MDKSRDIRRGGSRFSRQANNNNKQSGHKLFSGFEGDAFVSLEKSKREKVRKLSAVNGRGSPTPSSEMGCSALSDRENECPSPSQLISINDSTKRFKIPKKSFDDCNVVDHASVPRKLRSAMKKRNRDSVSPPLPESKRVNRTLGGESLQKDGVNLHKLNLKQRELQWSREGSTSGPITKDEEEVVETLYALAGMFPDNDPSNKNKVDCESLDGKLSSPPEIEKNLASEGKKESSSVCPPEAVMATSSANLEISPDEAVKTNAMIRTTTEQLPDLPDSKSSSTPRVSLDVSLPLLGKTESSDKRPSISGNFHGLHGLTLEFGFKPSKPETNALTERKPETTFEATSIGVCLKQEHVTKETQKNGLSSTFPLGDRSNGPSQPSTSKLPAWLDAALSSSKPSSSQNGASARKVSEVSKDGKTMKRCAAHVYVSRLIQRLQKPESKDSMPLQFIELKHQEEVKQAVEMPHQDFNKVTNGINGYRSSISLTANRNPYEAGSSSHLQHKNLHQDHPPVAQAPGPRNLHKQSYDFLPSSAGNGDGEINNHPNKVGNTFGALSRHQIPYLHSFPQHQSSVPFSLPQARSTSSAYSDQLSLPDASAQGQMLLPPYLNNPFYGYTSHQSMAKQQQQLQQQQRLWAAQLAANCRVSGTSAAMTQFPSWKSGKNESTAPMNGAHGIFPPPPSSLEALGSKYASITHHQQSLMPISLSLPPTKVKRQDHHLPFGYEESGAGFRSGGAIPMQLLCNERL